MVVMDVLSNIMGMLNLTFQVPEFISLETHIVLVYSIPTIVFGHWIFSQSTKSGWLVILCLSMFLCLSIYLLLFIFSCLFVFFFIAGLILLESVGELSTFLGFS